MPPPQNSEPRRPPMQSAKISTTSAARPSSVQQPPTGPNPDPHYTTFIRVPFPRGDFVDPPLVDWDASKDRALWKTLSNNPRTSDIDWQALADEFGVTLPFLLQEAAWLYERQLSQVRAQMRKVGREGTATPEQKASPSRVSTENVEYKRKDVKGQRRPSGLHLPAREQRSPADEGGQPQTPTPQAPRMTRTTSQNTVIQGRPSPRRGGPSRESLRRPSIEHRVTEPATANEQSKSARQDKKASRSPSPAGSSSSSSSSESDDGRTAGRPLTTRRPSRFGTKPQLSRSIHNRLRTEEEEEDAPAFLPLSRTSTQQHQDQAATIRGEPKESVAPSNDSDNSPTKDHQAGAISPSSVASSAAPVSAERARKFAISPRQRADLAGTKGAAGYNSEGAPSMSSSFSDLGGVS